MHRSRRRGDGAFLIAAVILGLSGAGARGQAVPPAGGGRQPEAREIVLFPFDDHGVPLTYGLRLDLVQARRRGVVLRPSESGPDAQHIINYGSVVEIDGELRIWYLCTGDRDPPVRDPEYRNDPPRNLSEGPRTSQDEEAIFRVCYATSRDGLEWEKPALGLVDYGASTRNNLVDLPIGDHRLVDIVVLHDPEDPDPERRFKMAFQSVKYRSALGVAWSPDGLRWKESARNPVNQHFFEISGLVRHDGLYYVNGHGGSPRSGPSAHAPRRMVTYVSADFEHWLDATALSFERKAGEVPVPWKGNAGEQVHTGASIWNRGNVLLGFYGMWHGHPSDDRRMVTMDLGLVVSNDALHFREPITDFRMVPAHEEGETVTHTFNPRLGSAGGGSLFGLALKQGQGWAHRGDHTLFWYSVWFQGDIRLATWDRDRLGYFEVNPQTGSRMQTAPHFVSAPLRLDGPHRVYVNADGLSTESALTLEVYDERLANVAGYTAADSVPLTQSGFRQPVEWRDGRTSIQSDRPVRVRVNFEGDHTHDLRVYAVYLTPEP